MKVTRVWVTPMSNNKNVVGYADVICDNGLALNDLRICPTKDGRLHVVYPMSQNSLPAAPRYVFNPINKDMQEMIDEAIIEEYYRTIRANDWR